MVVLIVVAAIEAAIVYGFVEARAAYHTDLEGTCLDECLGTWLGMMFMGALLFMWPIVSLLVVGFTWALITGFRSRHD